MNRKTLAYVLIAIAIGVFGYWLAAGREYYTLTQVQEKYVDPEDPFASETVVWKNEFRPGLLDLVGPIAGGLLLISGVLLYSEARRRRKVAHTTTTDTRTV